MKKEKNKMADETWEERKKRLRNDIRKVAVAVKKEGPYLKVEREYVEATSIMDRKKKGQMILELPEYKAKRLIRETIRMEKLQAELESLINPKKVKSEVKANG